MTRMLQGLCVGLLLLSVPTAGLSQQQATAAMRSQREAAGILARGIEAVGGFEAIETAGPVSMQLTLNRRTLGQAPRPELEGETPMRPAQFLVTQDATRDWVVAEAQAPDGTVATRVVMAEDPFIHDVAQNGLRDAPPGLGTFFDQMPLVPAILLHALERCETLRSLGSDGEGAEARNVISYADEDGELVNLYFSAANGDLLRAETLSTHPQLGDVAEARVLADYQPAGNLRLPRRIDTTIGSIVTSTAEVTEITVGAEFDMALLHRPEGVPDGPAFMPTGDAAELRVEEIAEGVWQVFNVPVGYNALFVEQENGVVVIEAPGPEGESQAVIEAIHDNVPGKPITDLVLTHHHWDHTPALPMYLGLGIPVTTTPGNVEFVRGVAAAPRAMATPTALGKPEIRVVEGRKTLGSGRNRFELIDVGPNPHADEILVAYFPQHKLMYVPDIYGYVPGFTPPPLLTAFADRFDELGLEVEKFATAHTEVTSFAEFREMVEAVRAGGGGG